MFEMVGMGVFVLVIVILMSIGLIVFSNKE